MRLAIILILDVLDLWLRCSYIWL